MSRNDSEIQLLSEALGHQLLNPLILQLNKDFSMCGIESPISESASPSEIVNELHRTIGKLIREDFQGFLNLLYRVDVPESELLRRKDQDMDAYIASASYLLLRREWKKVWLRNKIR